MKVDLEKVTLGHSPFSDKIFVGTSIKPGVWRNKVDITNAFLACVIHRFGEHIEHIQSSDGRVYEITVKEI